MKQLKALILIITLSTLVVACGGSDPMDPDTVSIDTMDLADSWDAYPAPAAPYDASMPPGPVGIPEHIEIHFDGATLENPNYSGPILYIIPVEAYKQMWDEADNTDIGHRLAMLEDLLSGRPDLATAQVPVLPFAAYQVMGAGNLGIIAQSECLDMIWGSGVRFVATPFQGVDVILNRNVVYIEQGLTDDGAFLVNFIYPPVSTSELPNSIDEVSEEEFQQVNSDWVTYRKEKEDLLNSLSASDWDPNLTALDEVIDSLQFGDHGQ